jgi:ATP/maltotriose-dependent transcriptional regulator MalT
VSEALYRYFAEEVVRGLRPEVERFLLLASIPNEIDPETANDLLGIGDESMFQRLAQDGLLQAVGDRYRFHPLLRSFLRRLLESTETALFAELTHRAIDAARGSQDWEGAFNLAIETGLLDAALEILQQATPSLLASGQTELLERWLRECGAPAVDNPGAIITRTELLIRQGSLSHALATVRDLATRLPPEDHHISRAWYLTGLASHLMSSEIEALNAQIKAEQVARTDRERSDALWGAYIAASELGQAEASRYLDAMEAMGLSDAASRLRIATGRMVDAAFAGSLRNLTDVFEPLLALVEHTNEPMIETSFLTRVAETQAARARYQEAVRFAGEALDIAETLHLEFAIPFCVFPRATAEIGLRKFSDARATIKRFTQLALAREDPYLEVARNVLQLKLRLSDSRHQYRDADVPHGAWTRAHVAVRGEYLSLRALSAAARSDAEAAVRFAEEARALSRGVDSVFCARFACLIAKRLKEGNTDALARMTIELIYDCADAEAYEALVLAARASDGWLPVAATDSTAASIMTRTLMRSGDISLAQRAGLASDEAYGVEVLLTQREREVLKYLARGLSNSAIAAQLFISESTVKVHVHHILRKLNVETRLQAVLKAAATGDS